MSKLIEFSSLKDLDYKKLGLKCGLEIHQQLNTGKLFCSCPCDIVPNDTLDKEVERKLRFSLSETGEIDKAALNEFKKGKFNVYKYNDKIACLVDLDEEPPKGPNRAALNTAVRVGQMLNVTFFDKFQFMRKLIIDGSVTGGFQRTAMLGFGGYLDTSFGKVVIEGINVEEDSCRTLTREHGHTIFSLDRQGIPLIEITTGPQIHEPEQVYDAARQIGNILRSFSETRRGLGTIRQDVNVSIIGGARIEIKGAQNLKLLPDVVANEVKRQMIYISILDELKERGIDDNNFSDWKIVDISEVFVKTTSKVVLSNLEGDETGVFGIKLNGFKGILGCEMQENFRFATEISDRNKGHFPTIKGLFHSDELPKYGITEDEVAQVAKKLGISKNDGFIILAGKSSVVKKSLKFILEIIEELIAGVPTEVRQVDPKGVVTKFSRPMPGSARMYPETDVPDIEVTEKYLKEMKEKIPELYSDRLSRVTKDLKLDESKVLDFMDKFSEDEVKSLLEVSGKSASALYGIVFDIPKDIKKREKIEPVDFKYSLFESLLRESKENDFNQSVIRDIFISLYKDKLDEVVDLKAYLDEKGLIAEQVDDGEIEAKLREIVEAHKGAPMGALMGQAMKAFGGAVDGKKISELLKKLMN